MSLFTPAEHKAAFLKMGLMGFAGSGKTWTSCLVAIGLYKAAIKKGMSYAGKPVFFIDTEGGSDYIAKDFEDAEVPLMVLRTRAFSDLKAAMVEAEASASVLIIDSISHFWAEFQEAYKEKKGRKRGLEFSDWGAVKQEWRKSFTEPYLNSNLHILMCGRASYEYDNYTDDAGKKQIEKSGVKMNAEKEMGFEPSLLVYMEHSTDPDTKKVSRKAIVMKDRFRVLDGKEIENPTFKSFVPHIERLNWGSEQGGVDVTRSSKDMIEPDQFDRRKVDREIVLEEINALFTKHFGATQDDKRKKLELMEAAFGTVASVALEKRISLEELITGYDRCHLQLEQRPSHYGRAEKAADEIPEHPPHKPRIRIPAATDIVEDAADAA